MADEPVWLSWLIPFAHLWYLRGSDGSNEAFENEIWANLSESMYLSSTVARRSGMRGLTRKDNFDSSQSNWRETVYSLSEM